MKLEHISVSRDNTWKQCKALYKYKYHLQLPIDEEDPIHLIYGKLVHRAAELFVESKGEQNIHEFAERIINGEIPLDEECVQVKLPAIYKKNLPTQLRYIQEFTAKIGYDGLREYEFNYDLDPPNNRMVKGFIDRLIQRGDKFYIVDYKTTKKSAWRKNRSTISKDLQLRCYGRIVQKEFGAKPENIKAALLYVTDNELVSTGFTEEALISAEKELLKSYREIENMSPDDVWGTVGPLCRYCGYRKTCPFYSLT